MRAPQVRVFTGAIVDLFAGGGGASVGCERATGRSPDVAINHDKEAISMHRRNHPGTKHYIENVWRVDPRKVLRATGKDFIELMWLSPDCKHFSKAKGGQPVRDKKIRSLASVAPYWIKRLGPKARPRVIVLENVEEFQKWGPLLPDGTPCPVREGLSFRRFVKQLQNLGYVVDFRELVAADYGAPTTRKRLFLVARCDGKPIVWPTPTHDQNGRHGLPKWRAAAECIDFTLPCPSIFERKKELAENTQRRIARGIRKFVIEAAQPFIVPVSHAGDSRVHSVSEPMRTITGAHRGEHAMVQPFIAGVGGRMGCSPERSVDRPMQTVTSKGDAALVVARIGQTGGGDQARGVDRPLSTVTSKAEHLLVAAHVTKFRSGATGSDCNEPMPTITAGQSLVHPAGAGHALGLVGATLINTRNGEREGQEPRCMDIRAPHGTVTAQGSQGALVAAFMAKHNAGHEATGQDLLGPVHAITATDSKALVQASCIAKLKGTGSAISVEGPLHTVQAGGNHYAEVRAFLMKYHRDGGQHGDCKDPMPTIPTRDSIGLVTVHKQRWVIADIGMRMLQPMELFKAHDFPATYIIDRGADGEVMTKEAQVRMVGNSVPPPMAEAIIRAQFGLVIEGEFSVVGQMDLLGAVA